MENIEKALLLKAELDKLRPINPEQEAIIMQKFRLDWDYHSNHLEGNSLTYGETKALIMFGITAQGKPLKDHFEITGHDEAIKWVTEIVKGDHPLTEKFIRELHVLLLKEPYEVPAKTIDGQDTTKRIEVGKYKTLPNHVKTVTGEIFRFATPEDTPAMMHELIDWYREKKETTDVNPIILAADFHYRFIRIHPFDDGNGRIARILMNFILMQFGYPPIIIKSDDKVNYFSALQLADSGMVEPFIEYIVKNLVRSLEIMISGAKGESIEDPDDLDKEIVLLEQKFRTIGKRLDIARTATSIHDILNDFIGNKLQLFIVACEKFDSFYFNHTMHIGMDEHTTGYFDKKLLSRYLNEIKVNIHSNTRKLSILYAHNLFKQMGFESFGHTSGFKFDFFQTKYKLTSSSNKELEKLYGEYLTEEEMLDLVKKLSQEHKIKIEEKLKEIQNTKP